MIKMNRTCVRIPRAFIPVDIGITEDSKREAVRSHDGRVALIADSHHSVEGSMLMGKIRVDNDDPDRYYFQVFKDEETLAEKRLQYHDLKSLIAEMPGAYVFGLNAKIIKDF